MADVAPLLPLGQRNDPGYSPAPPDPRPFPHHRFTSHSSIWQRSGADQVFITDRGRDAHAERPPHRTVRAQLRHTASEDDRLAGHGSWGRTSLEAPCRCSRSVVRCGRDVGRVAGAHAGQPADGRLGAREGGGVARLGVEAAGGQPLHRRGADDAAGLLGPRRRPRQSRRHRARGRRPDPEGRLLHRRPPVGRAPGLAPRSSRSDGYRHDRSHAMVHAVEP
jgi:hypothetical protein